MTMQNLTGSVTLPLMISKLNETPQILKVFFGEVDGLVTAYDGEHYFRSCSNCIIEIRKKYSIEKEFADGKHDRVP